MKPKPKAKAKEQPNAKPTLKMRHKQLGSKTERVKKLTLESFLGGLGKAEPPQAPPPVMTVGGRAAAPRLNQSLLNKPKPNGRR